MGGDRGAVRMGALRQLRRRRSLAMRGNGSAAVVGGERRRCRRRPRRPGEPRGGGAQCAAARTERLVHERAVVHGAQVQHEAHDVLEEHARQALGAHEHEAPQQAPEARVELAEEALERDRAERDVVGAAEPQEEHLHLLLVDAVPRRVRQQLLVGADLEEVFRQEAHELGRAVEAVRHAHEGRLVRLVLALLLVLRLLLLLAARPLLLRVLLAALAALALAARLADLSEGRAHRSRARRGAARRGAARKSGAEERRGRAARKSGAVGSPRAALATAPASVLSPRRARRAEGGSSRRAARARRARAFRGPRGAAC